MQHSDSGGVFNPYKQRFKFKYFLIDTSVLVAADGIHVIEQSLLKWLTQIDGKLVITDLAREEVEHQLKDRDPAKYEGIGATLNRLQQMNHLNVLAVEKDAVRHGVTNTDTLLDVISQNIFRDGFVLITQDHQVAQQAFLAARSEAISRDAKPFEAVFVKHNALYCWTQNTQPSDITTAGGIQLHGQKLEEEIAGNNYKVIPDSSALLLQSRDSKEMIGPPYFEDSLFPKLASTGTPLLLLQRVKREILKHSNAGNRNPELARTAEKCLRVLHKFKKHQLLVEVGEEDEVGDGGKMFADPLILRMISKYQRTTNLCVIVQDNALANALISSRDHASPYKLVVARINLKGVLTEATIRSENSSANASTKQSANTSPHLASSKPPSKKTLASAANPAKTVKSRKSPKNKSTPHPFPLSTQPRLLSVTPLADIKLPETGAQLSTTNGDVVVLGEFINQGGEGNIYQTSVPGQVCKVYHASCRTQERVDKLSVMLSRSTNFLGVAWPTAIVNDATGEFVGFLMPEAKGKTLRVAVQSKMFLAKNYPSWSRKDLTKLARRIVVIAKRLHQMNVFVGDVNALNILVDDTGNICFVDADSFQVGDYPCPVGTETFTPANRQGMDYKSFLRTADDELFAFATLIFMVLFPGKAPYSVQGGGEIRENIKEHRFAYDPKNTERPPEGPWSAIWSHLSLGLKKNFIDSFANDKRVSLDKWHKDLSYAIKELESGKANDDLFPQERFVKKERQIDWNCSVCGITYQVDQNFIDRLKSKNHQYKCDSCRAKSSLEFAQNTRSTNCNECGVLFDIKRERYDDLQSKGKDMWCRFCRENILSRPKPQRQSDSGCFVATAAFRNAEATEVQWLRGYREQVLQRTVHGRMFCRFYYRIGPLLAVPVNRSKFLQKVSRSGIRYLVRLLSVRT